MSLTTRSQSQLPALVLHPRTWNETSFQENLVVIALAFALYVCPFRNRLSNRRTQRTTLILGFALLALLISTTIYTATIFLATSKYYWAMLFLAAQQDHYVLVYFATSGNLWQSRRFLKRYVVTGPMVSQMQKVFSLLVESGMIYCALWGVVLAWQAGEYKGNVWESGDNSFWNVFNVIMNGALVPLIAIYPTVIIVVVALNRSHIENGFPRTCPEMSIHPLSRRPLAVAVHTTVTTSCDDQLGGSSERVLVIGGEDINSKDDAEGSSTHTTEERKLEDFA
ncbi:hypothetical protein V8D89_006310 [Ganoderma adspersum]